MRTSQAVSGLIALAAAPALSAAVFAPVTSISFVNSCNYNIHVWKQTGGDKSQKLDVMGPNITHTTSWDLTETGKRVGYIFGLNSNPGDTRAFLNTFSRGDKHKFGANAHVYADFHNPFEGANVSLSMAAGRIGTVSAATAAAAGTEIGAWINRAEEDKGLGLLFGVDSLAIGLHFCSYAGRELEGQTAANAAEPAGVLDTMQEKTFSNFGLVQTKGSAI